MAQILNALITVLTFAILGRVIMDWLVVGGILKPGSALEPVQRALFQITEPILRPIRRYARFGTIDLSPMVTIFILVIIQNAVAQSL